MSTIADECATYKTYLESIYAHAYQHIYCSTPYYSEICNVYTTPDAYGNVIISYDKSGFTSTDIRHHASFDMYVTNTYSFEKTGYDLMSACETAITCFDDLSFHVGFVLKDDRNLYDEIVSVAAPDGDGCFYWTIVDAHGDTYTAKTVQTFYAGKNESFANQSRGSDCIIEFEFTGYDIVFIGPSTEPVMPYKSINMTADLKLGVAGFIYSETKTVTAASEQQHITIGDSANNVKLYTPGGADTNATLISSVVSPSGGVYLYQPAVRRKVYTPDEENMNVLEKQNLANVSELLSVMQTLDRQPVEQTQRVDPTDHVLTHHTNNFKYWLQKAWSELILYLGHDPGCAHNLKNLKDQIIANVK